MYQLPRPDRNSQTLLQAIADDPGNQIVNELADELDEAERTLATSRLFDLSDADKQGAATLASVFEAARGILARARK